MRRRDEPSYEDVYRDNLYDDYYGKDAGYDDYYYYDGRRKEDEYFYESRRKRQGNTVVSVPGSSQPIMAVFRSDDMGNAGGVSAQVNDLSGKDY